MIKLTPIDNAYRNPFCTIAADATFTPVRRRGVYRFGRQRTWRRQCWHRWRRTQGIIEAIETLWIHKIDRIVLHGSITVERLWVSQIVAPTIRIGLIKP